MGHALLSCVKKANCHSFSKFDYHFRRNTLSLAEKVENRISAEIKTSKGTVKRDGERFMDAITLDRLLLTYLNYAVSEKWQIRCYPRISLMNALCKCVGWKSASVNRNF